MLSAADWTLYQYRVDFAPEEDRTGAKRKMLRDATASILGGYLFDGTVLFTPNRLNPDPMELFVENEQNQRFRITMRFVGEVMKSDSHRLQVFNIILRKCLGFLNLQLVGRNYFDAAAKVDCFLFLSALNSVKRNFNGKRTAATVHAFIHINHTLIETYQILICSLHNT